MHWGYSLSHSLSENHKKTVSIRKIFKVKRNCIKIQSTKFDKTLNFLKDNFVNCDVVK